MAIKETLVVVVIVTWSNEHFAMKPIIVKSIQNF